MIINSLPTIAMSQSSFVDLKRNVMQEELRALLDTWENENENSTWDVDPVLRRIAEILEEATNDFLQSNPDPMDDRHPLKSQPLHAFGHLLKMITRIESFVNKLVISYLLARDNTERNVLAARLLLSLLPGIDTNVVLSDADSLFVQLFRWAEQSDSRELRAYSMALLGAGMGAEQAHQYRLNNLVLIPIALQRLRDLYAQMVQKYRTSDEEMETARRAREVVGPTDFAEMLHEERGRDEKAVEENGEQPNEETNHNALRVNPRKRHSDRQGGLSPPHKRSLPLFNQTPSGVSVHSSASTLRDAWNLINAGGGGEAGNSNSSWRQIQPILVGTNRLYPLSIEMEQRLILHYLGPTSEYQDNLSIVLEHHALGVILDYLKMDGPNHMCRDIRLLFDSIRYISSLLIHRKFAWEFIAAEGVQQLLRVNRQSLALTAVATCLYYLAYSTDIMEKVCHLPDPVLSELMDYALYAIDHSHESGRASIAMFLTYALQFRAMLERFDQRDGLRRLYNYVSTLTILQRNEEEQDDMVNDDHYAQSIATIKNAIHAFRTYLSSHIFLKMEHMKRTQIGRNISQPKLVNRAPDIPHAIPSSAHPHSKPMALNEETERGCVDYLIRTQYMLQMHHHSWKPIEEMRNLGIFRLLFTIISNYPDWCHWERQGKADTLKLAIEVLRLATVSPKVQLDACETIVIRQAPVQGLGLIMELCEGEIVNDPQVQRFSLEVLINCLCAPSELGNGCLGFHYRFSNDYDRDLLPKELCTKFPLSLDPAIGEFGSSSSQKPSTSTVVMDSKEKGIRLFLNPEHILKILWKCAQQNNAIMVLTNLLHKQTPPTEADLLRELACRTLNGIARYEPVRQILSKLSLIAANELNALMQTPILKEKRMEHNRFCEQARHLIEVVSQTKLQGFASMEMTQENLWKAAVVAQTRIEFNEKELLQLIYQHLADIGFKKTARQLQSEAELPNIPASKIPSTPASLPGFPRQNATSFANVIARRMTKYANNTSRLPQLPPATPSTRSEITATSTAASKSRHTSTSNGTPTTGNRLPIRLLSTPGSTNHNAVSIVHGTSLPSSSVTGSASANTLGGTSFSFSLKIRPHKSLSEIVQSYFRNEHALCRNPVANCPPFSLFYPHRCPEPKLLYSAPTNFVSRLHSRSTPSFRCTMETLRQADRRLVHSRFRHCKTFSEENETFTCANFSLNDEHIFMGTYAGEMYVFNVRTGAVDATYNCHHSSITAIQPATNGFMLTSSAFVKPYSVLWRMEPSGLSIADRLIDFKEDQFIAFGNLSTSQIVGTQGPKAVVYDTETALPIVELYDERLANHYTRNKAYFDPRDELILNDGILFDPRIGGAAYNNRVVHKFDKMNVDNSGVFHPRGTEVIINSEVWDLRTHRLIHTVPALDQCQVAFNATGSIMFGIVHQEPTDVDDRFFQMFSNYFRTFDSTNYEVISTHDTRKPLLDICSGHSDNYVGVIETSRASNEDTNFFKLYEVGRRREADEEDEDEQEEPNPEEDEDDDVYSSTVMSTSSSANEDENNEDSDATIHSSHGSPAALILSMDEEDTTNDGELSNDHQQDAHVEEENNGIDDHNNHHQNVDIEDGAEAEDENSDDDYDSSYSDEDFEISSEDFSP